MQIIIYLELEQQLNLTLILFTGSENDNWISRRYYSPEVKTTIGSHADIRIIHRNLVQQLNLIQALFPEVKATIIGSHAYKF